LVVAGTASNLEPNLTGDSRVAVEQLKDEQIPPGGTLSRSASETIKQFGERRLPPLEHVEIGKTFKGHPDVASIDASDRPSLSFSGSLCLPDIGPPSTRQIRQVRLVGFG
jgi:hypothetical protein